MTPPHDPRQIDARIRAEMRRLVRRVQAGRLHARSAAAWAACAGAMVLTLLLAWYLVWPTPATIAVASAVFLTCGWRIVRWWSAPITDYSAAAAVIERAYPELGHGLRTAIEQRPDAEGRYTFMQARLINQVLEHAYRHFWSRSPIPSARRWAATHAAALVAACALVALSVRWDFPSRALPDAGNATALDAGLEITPGDAEVARGTTIIVTARFGGRVPARVHLDTRQSDGSTRRIAMPRSLADPVFAATLSHVDADFDYTVDFGDGTSRTHRIRVYDLPRMTRGDATLTYPEFTGIESRTIQDTRRISAVEGSELDYLVHTNKPVREAAFVSPEGERTVLVPVDEDRTRFRFDALIETSTRFAVHLVDDAGRSSAKPDEVRIEALPNRRPVLKMTFPRGDQSVSALEEVTLEGSVADDFGLLDYGIAWSVAAGEPHYFSRRRAATERAEGETSVDEPQNVREASFSHRLSLEAHGLQPDQLVTWFLWADDRGSDGLPRRTHGDLQFAEVRPFEEIFRESEGGGSGEQEGAGAGDAADLLDMQRDISLAIWKLRDQSPGTDRFHQDSTTVLAAQNEARGMLRQMLAEVREHAHRLAADEAAEQMKRVADQLDEAREQSSVDPLNPAWSASQAAYQALLRMQPRESQVGQERNRAGGQRGGRGNQRQLDQLRFKDNEDRYETQREAQLSATPEQREQMQTLARLRELARRQSDLNERLQELQTALQAAADDEQAEEIRRELKRLEEEQRRMLADVDELRQRMDQRDPGSQTAQTREQVERTREDMRRASEALQEEAVSRALASGTRAQENLEQAREDLRQGATGEFADDLRELRRQSRALAEAQARAEQDLAQSGREAAPSLDGAAQHPRLAEAMEDNRQALDALTDAMREVTEKAEEAEPGLYRQLYDILREQGQGGGPGDRMEAAAELLRGGFIDQARELQPGISSSLQRLARGVEQAAESVLGDEAGTLRFAQTELEELAQAVQSPSEGGPEADSPADGGSQPDSAGESDRRGAASGRSGDPGAERPDAIQDLNTRIAELGRTLAGRTAADEANPITGADFGAWEERLRTVEALLEDPESRGQLARARELAAELRREYRRHGSPPSPATVERGIVAPLDQIRAWVRQELARREDPATLQPVDRDPVPDEYAEAVQRYYEALGE